MIYAGERAYLFHRHNLLTLKGGMLRSAVMTGYSLRPEHIHWDRSSLPSLSIPHLAALSLSPCCVIFLDLVFNPPSTVSILSYF